MWCIRQEAILTDYRLGCRQQLFGKYENVTLVLSTHHQPLLTVPKKNHQPHRVKRKLWTFASPWANIKYDVYVIHFRCHCNRRYMASVYFAIHFPNVVQLTLHFFASYLFRPNIGGCCFAHFNTTSAKIQWFFIRMCGDESESYLHSHILVYPFRLSFSLSSDVMEMATISHSPSSFIWYISLFTSYKPYWGMDSKKQEKKSNKIWSFG